MKYLKLLGLFALFMASQLQAQRFPEHPEEVDPRNKGKAILFHFGLGGQLPGGDLYDRFGLNGVYGGGVEFLTENNFFIGLEGLGIFGTEVKDDPLINLRTPDGFIIGNDRALASVALRQRGWYAGGNIGKIFTFNDQRHGLRVSLGGGWQQHKIRVQDNRQVLTQITGDYIKGYDRLTAGFTLNQFIGWQHLGKLRRNNWMIGFEFSQGFTKSFRDWDFSEMKKLEGNRLDLRFGIKAAWTLPFYMTKSDEIYY
ncbi:MAG: hypothetical protein JNJ57_18810 [Saprospiraceae bacterium]|nr:hypothetical protein [Saprospiraceae bacterium]